MASWERLILILSMPGNCLRYTSETAAHMPQEIPVVFIAAFSTCANANPPSAGMIASIHRIRFSVLICLLLVPNRKYDPGANYKKIQCQTTRQDCLHSLGSHRRRTTPDRPHLVNERSQGNPEEERLQTLEPDEATRADQGN